MRNNLINLPNDDIDTFYRSHHCDTYVENKATRRSFKETMERATKPGEVFYMDVQGPFQTQSLEGHKYIVGFIDSFSRRCFTYYTDRRNKVPDIFINQFYPNILTPCIDNNLSGGHAKVISDNGEFKCIRMEVFCNSNKIKQYFTCPYTPEHNAPIERVFRALGNMCNTMLREKELDVDLWEYAHETAVYIYNRLPRRNIKQEGTKSPEEMFYGIKPSLKHVRIFGSKAFVHISEQTRLKNHLPKAV